MIGDEQQRTAALHPIGDGCDLFLGECLFVRAFVIKFFGAESVGDHEDLEPAESSFNERLSIANDVVTVVLQQIDERFITAIGGVEVVMRLVKHHARSVFVSRTRDGSIEFRIGLLLRERNRREAYQ